MNKSKVTSILLILVTSLFDICASLNLLVVHPAYCGSHALHWRRYGRHLAATRGYKVTQLEVGHSNYNPDEGEASESGVERITLDLTKDESCLGKLICMSDEQLKREQSRNYVLVFVVNEMHCF